MMAQQVSQKLHPKDIKVILETLFYMFYEYPFCHLAFCLCFCIQSFELLYVCCLNRLFPFITSYTELQANIVRCYICAGVCVFVVVSVISHKSGDTKLFQK